MIRAAACLLLLTATPAVAQVAVDAAARATIVDPMMLRLAWPTAMPNVREATGGLDGAQFTGEIPSMGMAMSMPANARLVIRRIDDTGAIVTAPTGFQVMAGGPREGLLVRTSTQAALSAAVSATRPNRLIVGGALAGSAAASIGVASSGGASSGGARGPELAATDAALAVVVQYN